MLGYFSSPTKTPSDGNFKRFEAQLLKPRHSYQKKLHLGGLLYLCLMILFFGHSLCKISIQDPLRAQVLMAASSKETHAARAATHLQTVSKSESTLVVAVWKGPGLPPGSVGVRLSEPGRDSLSNKKYLNPDDFWHDFSDSQNIKANTWHQKVISNYNTYESVGANFLGTYETEAQDYVDSKALIEKLKAKGMQTNYAIDVGAAFGRVTQNLLSKIFTKTDLLEGTHHQMAVARKNLEVIKDKVGQFYEVALQDFNFERKYDLVWMQGVLSLFTDEEFVRILRKAKASLNKGGFIVVKDYSTQPGTGFIFKNDIMSLCRSDEYLKKLFKQAGLTLIIQEATGYEDISKVDEPVRSYALRPE